MCCGGTQTTTSNTSSNSGPAAQGAISRANQVSQTPYTPYTGQRVAPFSQDQNTAFQDTRNNQGIGNPYLAQASQYATQGATPISAADITNNLNSTGLNQQVTALQNLFNQQNATANSTVNGNSALRGAQVGGDRAGVAQALTQQANTLAQAPTLASAYNTAYGQSAALSQGNQQAAANAAYTYGNLGQEAQNQATTDTQNLLTTGGLQQQENQAQLNVPYQDYLTAQGYPFQTAQWYSGILGALGGLTGSNSSTTQPSPSLFSQLLGAGGAGIGAYMASDERIKENIAPVGEMYDGTPIYRYNMAGQPQTQIGVLAQDIEQRNPAAVAQDQSGIKHVDYDVATRPAIQAGLGQPFSNGGPVDPDFARLASHLGHAVSHMQKMPYAQQGYAQGGTITSPTELQVQPLNLGQQVTAESLVPEGALSPAHIQAAQAPNPNMTGSNMQSSGMNSLAQGLGSYLAKPASPTYTDPGTAANGGWTTTVTPSSGGLGGWISNLFGGSGFADGGVPHAEHMAAGGGAYLRYLQPPPSSDNSSSLAPVALHASDIPGINNTVPGISTTEDAAASPAAITPFANNVQPERIVPDATIPPTATPYGPPSSEVARGSQAPEEAAHPSMLGAGDVAPSEGSNKAWYEPGSNPSLGRTLMAAGFGTMAGTSPFAAVNIGQGGLEGVKAYLQQQQYERQAALLQVQAERQAEVERHNMAIEQLQSTNQPKVSTNAFGERYWTSGPKAGQLVQDAGGVGAPSGGGSAVTGDAALAHVPAPVRGQVKAIAEYRAAPVAGARGQPIMDLVQTVNPGYDQTFYPEAQKTINEYSPAGATGKSFQSVNMSLRHVDQMWNAFKHLQNYSTLPGVSNFVHSEYSANTDPEYQYWLGKFEQGKKGISTELDKAMKGTGAPDVTGIEDIKKGFSPYASPEAMRGTVEGAIGLLKGKLDGADTAWQQGTHGKSSMVGQWLQPDAKKIYDKFTSPEWGTEDSYGRPDVVGGGNVEAGTNKPASPQKPLSKQEILKMPDGPVTLGGKTYTKRGTQLIEGPNG